MLFHLSGSHYAVSKNYEELISKFTFYEGNIEIWDVKKRQELNFFLRELSRLLLNYLSSTFSLIRHYANVRDKLSCSEINKNYSKEVIVLDSNDCCWFVKDLRKVAQHEGLPVLSAQFSFSRLKGTPEFKQRILLDKNALLESKDLKQGSKRYINSQKEIDLKSVINEYQKLVDNFFIWFNAEVNRIYFKQLQEFGEIDREIGDANRELFNKS